MADLIVLGRQLVPSDTRDFIPLDQRLDLLPIECIDINYNNIKGIFDDARKYLVDHEDACASQKRSILIALLNLQFGTVISAMRFPSKLKKMRARYGFADEFSDRSCIARIYICGWRLQMTLSTTHFILQHNPKVHRDEHF